MKAIEFSAPTSCLSLPTIHLLLNEDYEDCYRAACPGCGWRTAPYTSPEPAIVDSWRHFFGGDRISDLRRAQLRAKVRSDRREAARERVSAAS